MSRPPLRRLAGSATAVAALVAAGLPVLAAPAAGPFGTAFTFTDPDGYAITVHDRP